MISSFRFRTGRIASTALNYSSSYTQRKEAHHLKKMMDKMKVRQNIPKSEKLLEKSLLSTAYHNEGLSKRVTTLNKLYMEHILVDIHKGEYGRQFVGLGLEITKVSLASGLNFLNIYWASRNALDIPENVLNEILLGALAELQQGIGQLRFTPRAPLLKFVRDTRLERETYLERIFESADFGRDFEPTYGKKVLTRDFNANLSKIPEMRQDVLGLDHARIKGRILAEIKKFKAISTAPLQDEENEEEEEERQSPQKLIRFSREEFYKFYKRKRILELKMKKKEAQEGQVGMYDTKDVREDLKQFEVEDFSDDPQQFEVEEYLDLDDEVEKEETRRRLEDLRAGMEDGEDEPEDTSTRKVEGEDGSFDGGQDKGHKNRLKT